MLLQCTNYKPLRHVSNNFWGVAVEWFGINGQKCQNIHKILTFQWQQLGPLSYRRILTSIWVTKTII